MIKSKLFKPKLNPSLLLSPVENGYVAYDPATNRLHELNALGALLAELCDGEKDITELQEMVTPLAPSLDGRVFGRWFEEALAAGLVLDGTESGAAQRELTAAELTDISKRLRTRGNVYAAFLCQKRAADLERASPLHWLLSGELAHMIGRRADALDAYSKYLDLKPNDAEIRHIVSALKDETPPPRVPDQCIRQLYQRFSSFYEENVCGELDYQAPQKLEQLIRKELPVRNHLNVLDMGCGTGLMGARLKDLAAFIAGIDLSPEMIERAESRKIYDYLDTAELTQWLKSSKRKFDLAVASDTLIYFGDLKSVVELTYSVLADEGYFAFTLESGAQGPYQLTDSGRYAHHQSYVRKCLKQAGFSVLHIKPDYLRMEYGKKVVGLYVLACKSKK